MKRLAAKLAKEHLIKFGIRKDFYKYRFVSIKRYDSKSFQADVALYNNTTDTYVNVKMVVNESGDVLEISRPYFS